MKRRIRLRKKLAFKIRKRDKVLLITLVILTLTLFINYSFDKKSRSTILEFAVNETTLLSTYIINEAIEQHSYLFESSSDFISESKDSEGNIISVDFNTINVNKSLVIINESILESLKKVENGHLSTIDFDTKLEILENRGNIIYYIPFGIITSNIFLTALGPKIPVKMNAIGRVTSNIETKLEEYGINNVLLTMSINIEVTELVLLPFISEKVVINVSAPLVMKLIEGSIPNVYGGLLTNTSSLNTLNVE